MLPFVAVFSERGEEIINSLLDEKESLRYVLFGGETETPFLVVDGRHFFLGAQRDTRTNLVFTPDGYKQKTDRKFKFSLVSPATLF